ncbi:MAG: DUF6142 family protein [Lachnospiraceae bacterium]|nr:DUF6142 family protein [Lachnospiraceae bacterium]
MFFKRNYLFTSNSRSDKGVISSVCGLISVVSFIVTISIVLKAGGNTGSRLGAVGFVACFFSLVGIVLGIMSLVEKDKFRLFPRLGFFSSLLSLLLWGGVICVGAFGL